MKQRISQVRTQLAANHAVSGGTYEYGYRYLNPLLGLIAGWVFLCAKTASAATAALGFAAYFLRLIQSDLTIMPLVAVGAVVRARGRRRVTFVTFGRPETCLVTVNIVNIRASARGVSRSRHPLAVASATSSLSRSDGEGDRA